MIECADERVATTRHEPRPAQSAAPLRIDSSFFSDRNPATLQPSDGAIAFLTECLWGTKNAAPRGYLVVSDLEASFRQHGLRHFAGVIPQRKCDLPHSTQFLQRWILEASRLWQLRKYQSGGPLDRDPA